MSHVVTATIALLAVSIVTPGCETRPPRGSSSGAEGKLLRVTPVSGPSWLHHLGLSLEETRMGQMGGAGPPGRTARREPELSADRSSQGPLAGVIRDFFSSAGSRQGAPDVLNRPFTITGEDLYRLNCQSCHGPDGSGAPPEINSLVDPVRSTSPALIEQRLAKLGRTIEPALAKKLAAEAERPLRDRLTRGGKKMPPFLHLEGAEVQVLLDFLRQLADVPEAPDQQTTVTESAARVGEHLVKGTCRICHDATGPGGGHMMMMRRVVPSLASFPEQKSVDDVVRKVLEGSTGMMDMMGAARMPVFTYLTQPEVAAAYLYLATYPPRS